MAFWQENYQFIKEIYEMRHSKMAEWMENVEKVGLSFSRSSVTLSATICIIFQAIARIMADKVYTSAEFKRERDNFQVGLKYIWIDCNLSCSGPLQRS